MSGHVQKRRSSRLVLLLAALLAVVSCGESGPTAGGDDLQKITFRTVWTMQGHSAPFVLGVQKGFFREEGLDVTLQEGSGSSVGVQLAGNGTVDFAVSDTLALVSGVRQGAPVRMLFNFTPSTAYLLMWVKGRTPDLASPKDLKGKRLGVYQGSSTGLVVPYLLENSGLTSRDVNVVQGPPPTSMDTALLQGRIDVIMTTQAGKPELEAIDPSLDFGALELSKFDVDLQSDGIIANGAYVRSNPEIVAAFIRAVQRSWAYVLEDPAHHQEAIDMTHTRFPEVSDSELGPQLEDRLNNFRTGSPANEPLGFMPSERWENTLKIYDAIFGESRLPMEAYYTNEFLVDDYQPPT